jgi:hypothetical protein
MLQREIYPKSLSNNNNKNDYIHLPYRQHLSMNINNFEYEAINIEEEKKCERSELQWVGGSVP